MNLLKVFSVPQSKAYANSTRLRRGSDWDENYSVYNLVSSLSTRQADVRRYGCHKAYIWGKKFGVSKGNVQVAAGVFIGANTAMEYKVFGRAKAVGHAFGRTKTALDFLVLREKRTTSASTKLYAEIVGKILLDFNEYSASIVCRNYRNSLYKSSKYTLFNLRFSVFVYATTLSFGIAGYVRLNTDLIVEFCENIGSLTAEGGLETVITMELQAYASANLLVRYCHTFMFWYNYYT